VVSVRQVQIPNDRTRPRTRRHGYADEGVHEPIGRRLTRLVAQTPADDCAAVEIPIVLGVLGADTLPALTRFLNDESNPSLTRIPAVTAIAAIAAIAAIERIGVMHPGRRDDCIAALRPQLARHRAL